MSMSVLPGYIIVTQMHFAKIPSDLLAVCVISGIQVPGCHAQTLTSAAPEPTTAGQADPRSRIQSAQIRLEALPVPVSTDGLD
jgi:hypothetical protein